ncbi:hypothetical protein EHN46_21885 [Salmonella enterica]|nr:hypothetical protein [Salmonella enterica]EBB7908442.1 hypothetical protein [Salmonella enterica]EBK3282646.1 hypothetical protein [Salmonella enterica]ECI6680436.1 hypothetical protein [Salmonella enterica subsp. enterica]
METELIMGAMIVMATLSLWAREYKFRSLMMKSLCIVSFVGFTCGFVAVSSGGDPSVFASPSFAFSMVVFIIATQAKLFGFMKATGRV